MTKTTFQRIALIATILALCVVVLGAYVRLSDAGLGCPDWPGCYGHVGVPESEQHVEKANSAFPERPVEVDKAWKEMIHRYFAGLLGLLILALAVMAWKRRHESDQPLVLPLFLLGLVIFQALLGMWTVTLLLKPVVVMAHLMGGLTTLALLWWLVLRQSRPPSVTVDTRGLKIWALLGLLLVVCQAALGGWTSTNYAALACPDFPTCQTYWWPPMDFKEAFVLWRGLGVSYEGGVLDNDARVTIHMVHRLGAMVVLCFVGWLIWKLINIAEQPVLRLTSIAIALLLALQISLGIANVVMTLPLPIAVAHNAGAALLILALVTLNHIVNPRKTV
ncbi:MAG: COX15/CtaA family protein [Candidatus Competibacteraceae bacterium]|nr:COX15/CtaA family protein [Candidatus Competibacteraceae bacterium]